LGKVERKIHAVRRMRMKMRTGKIVGGAFLVVVLLAVLVFAAACGGTTTSSSSTASTPGGSSSTGGAAGDVSLGKTVWVNGTDAKGAQITRTTDMGVLGKDGCVACHGTDAKGKAITTSLGKIDAPDIRWSVISQPIKKDDGSTDPAYDATKFAGAVRDGTDSAGGTLDKAMPRWQVTDEEVNGLIAYLKTL
jgi:cytochrome c oxidase subunit 2